MRWPWCAVRDTATLRGRSSNTWDRSRPSCSRRARPTACPRGSMCPLTRCPRGRATCAARWRSRTSIGTCSPSAGPSGCATGMSMSGGRGRGEGGTGRDAVRGVRRCFEALRPCDRGGRRDARGWAGRGPRAARAERQRQDDVAAAAGRLRAAGRGPHDHRRGGRRRAVARAAALRHGVSALRLVSASRRGRDGAVRAHGTREAGTGKREPQGRRGAGARGPARLRAAQSAGAVGRAAAAGGAGARARPRAARAAARRAAVEPRPRAAGAHTPRVASAHQARRDHDPLRDARAGGGLRPGRPGRGPRHGAARPGRDPGRPVRAPREPLRRHVRRSRQRIPRRGGAGIRRGGRSDRRSAPRGAAVLRDRDPGRGEGAALHRRRRVVPRGRRPRGALRGARRARGGARGRSRLRRGDTGADVRRGAPVSAGNRRRLPGALLTLLLAWLVLYPILVVVAEAARGDAIAAFLSRGGEWHALWASLWISLASVALAAAVGVPLAFLFEWLDFPGRKTLGSVIPLPPVLPPFVGVIPFPFLYGGSGFVAGAVQHVLGLGRAPWRLQGAGAILLVHAYSMYVYFYLFTRAGLAKLDASMLEAAQALGAGRWETLRRVTLPLIRPALAGAALLVFMTALGSFSAPYVFGGGFRVMTTQIVATKLNGELPLAMVETVALASVALGGLLILRHTEGDDILVALGKGTAPRRRPIQSRGGRALATAAGWLLALLLLLPHLTLGLVSLVPYGTWTTEAVPPGLSLVNYQRLFGEPEPRRPLVNSLWMAAASTAAAVALALVAGTLVGRRRPGRIPWRGPIEGLLALPWALPGTVFAVALATTFSAQRPCALRWVLVGTVALLPLGLLVRNLPLTGRAILAGFRQLDPALDEAAASLGAGRRAAFRRVTLPLLRPPPAAGASPPFLAAPGGFVTAIVLYTYDNRPIAIEIMSSLRLSELGVAAAFGVILMGVSALVLALGARR